MTTQTRSIVGRETSAPVEDGSEAFVELLGGRVNDVHWIQDRKDQMGIVRDYVKWHYALTRTENMSHVITRAFQVAQSDPAGPVYMTILREMLMDQGVIVHDVRAP